MILKCPNCGDEYEVQAKGNLDRFTMTCPTCGTDITIYDEIKINAVVNKDGVGYVKKEDSHSGRSWKFIVALIVIMGLLAISVPEKSKHFDKLSEFVIKRTKDNSSMDQRPKLTYVNKLMYINNLWINYVFIGNNFCL